MGSTSSFGGDAVLVSTDVFAWCGLGTDLDGRYRKLPATDKAAGEERVQGLAGAWRVAAVGVGGSPPPNPNDLRYAQELTGAIVEITPEHIAWVRYGSGGRSDWSDYCADPRLSPAEAPVDALTNRFLAMLPSTSEVAITRVWQIQCSEKVGFGGTGSLPLALLADGRLSLTTDSGEVVVLSPAQAFDGGAADP